MDITTRYIPLGIAREYGTEIKCSGYFAISKSDGSKYLTIQVLNATIIVDEKEVSSTFVVGDHEGIVCFKIVDPAKPVKFRINEGLPGTIIEYRFIKSISS